MRDIKQILWTIIFMLLISGIIMQHTSNSTKNATYDGRTQNITSSIIMQHTLNGTENKTYYENIQNDIKRINTRKTSPIISIIPFLIFTSIIILYIIISLRKSVSIMKMQPCFFQSGTKTGSFPTSYVKRAMLRMR
ncbi:uncharacterized protein [Linepithema humile]|uniref:uncharacterized protein isoform X4 n=1 Tax=Linepithema humile TaxID=83485 RepID=UPI00351F7BBE